MFDNFDFVEARVDEINQSIKKLGEKGQAVFEANPILCVAGAFLIGFGAAFLVHAMNNESGSSLGVGDHEEDPEEEEREGNLPGLLN